MEKSYEQQFKEHAVHNSLASLEEAVVQSMLLPQALEIHIELQKLQKTAIFIREKIGGADADLVPTSALDNTNTYTNSALVHVNNFLTTQDTSNITNAIHQIDAALSQMPLFNPISLNKEHIDILDISKSQIDSFIKYISQKTHELDKGFSDLAGKQATLNLSATKAQSTADASTKQSNDLISSLQKNNQDIISTLQKQGQDVISTIQKQFTDAQSNRATTFETSISEYKNKYDTELEKLEKFQNDKFNTHFTGFTNHIKSITDDASVKHARIIELYGIVASDSVGGEYAKTSEAELTTANTLRTWGIRCLIFSIAWVLACILISIFNGSTFGTTQVTFNLSAYHAIPAATITFIIVSISAYLLFQSEKHREISLWANQINLELKAFEPFIYSIGDELIKIELRKSLTNQLFGHIKNPQNIKEKTETGLPTEKILELLTKVSESIKK